jgi:hypothetical protein
MPRGLNNIGDFRNGNPVPATNPKFDSNPVTWTPTPTHFGNAITTPKNFGNVVTLPKNFGNPVTLP